jgi:hypothetical protein
VTSATQDPVNHPSHYTSHPSGVECIVVVEHMTFNVGNAVKYLWRAGLKGAAPQSRTSRRRAGTSTARSSDSRKEAANREGAGPRIRDLVESWGSDERIIEAARMSTQKGFEGWGPKPETARPATRSCSAISGEQPRDAVRDGGAMTIEVQAPIFVFREWHRHRTQSYNEMSARYAPLPDEELHERRAPHARRRTGEDEAGEAPERRLDEADRGVPLATWSRGLRGHARTRLPARAQDLGVAERAGPPRPARWRATRGCGRARTCATGSVSSRSGMAPQAQWEIRQYADAVAHLIDTQFPRTSEIFHEGRA